MFQNKSSLKFLLGIPILFLVVSFLIELNNPQDEIFAHVANPYLKSMPDSYSKLIEKKELETKEDSLLQRQFQLVSLENELEQQLLIFKSNPKKWQLGNDFIINVFTQNKPLVIKHTNNGVLYNLNNIEYVVFKVSLPLINIEKVEVKQVLKNSKSKPWSALIENPFTKSFNYPKLQENKSIGQTTPPNIYKPFFIKELQKNNIKYVDNDYVLKENTLVEINMKIEDYVNQESVNVLVTEGINTFFNKIEDGSNQVLSKIEIFGNRPENIRSLIEDAINKNKDLDEVFDFEKIAIYKTLLYLYGDTCNKQTTFILNNGKLEPLFDNKSCFGNNYKYIDKPTIDNSAYLDIYLNTLNRFSSNDFVVDPKEDKSTIDIVKLISNYYPNEIFSSDLIKINQAKISKTLNQSTIIKPELISIDSDKMVLSIYNVSYYPVNIYGLNHKKKSIADLNPVYVLPSKKRDTITIDLPRSFENLFVSKKKKVTGFLLDKHIYDLYVSYSISGLGEKHLSSIIPYQEKHEIRKDLFRDKSKINNHEHILVNKEKKIITFKRDSVSISSALVIPKGFTFRLNEGMNIDILDGGKIISYSPFDFNGSKEKPINITSSDRKGQGILVINSKTESSLEHVNFSYLTNPKHGHWSVTGAVTFYESPVNLKNVSVSNNSCEDALNIVRTEFIMNNCEIKNTQSDAFDGDFVKGKITNSFFDNLGNDAIDVSGSDISIINVVVTNAGDKGLSAGEDSKMTINNVQISNSEIGIAGKDLSIVEGDNVSISDTKLGFTAFQKKPEFGPSNITVTTVTMKGVEMNYLIESSSTLLVDGEKIETSQNVKDRMYGVEFGRSSAETRNSQ